MTVVNQGGERRSFEDAADERQPLLGENLDAYGKVPQEDRAIAIYAASQSISTRTLGDDPPHKPWGPLMVLLALTAVQPLCFELIFPFVNQMVLENHITDDPEKVGFYTGIVESVFQVTGTIAVLPCSWISDHIGRKPVILTGTLGMAISIALFGTAKSYGAMILYRCIGGTLGGVMAAIKTSASEQYPNQKQLAKALALWQIAYKTGQVIGQPLGGLLSHPARTISFFDTPFWRNYPFALPCFVAGASALLFAFWALFALPESLTKSTDITEAGSKARAARGSIWSLPRPIVYLLLSSFIMVLSSEMIFVVYPLFGFTPIASGGLGISEPQIGLHMGLRCTLNILVLFSYTPFAAHVNSMKLYRFSMWLWPINVAFFPVLHALAQHGPGVQSISFFAILIPFFLLWSVGNLVWPSSQLVLNNASPSPEMLATINGLSQMIYTIMFAITPAFITSLFAYSIEHDIWGGNMVYVVMVGIGVFGGFYCMVIKDPSTKEQRPEGPVSA